MASEAMEIITMNIDKYQQTKNYEVSLKLFTLTFYYFFLY